MPLAVAYTIERHERRILGTTQSVGEEIAELEQVLQLVRRGAFRLSSSKQPAPQPSTSSLRDLLRAPMAYLSARWAGNHSTVETSIEPALAPTVERALHRRYAPVHNALQTLQAQLRHAQRRMLLACSRLQHAIGGVSAEPQPVTSSAPVSPFQPAFAAPGSGPAVVTDRPTLCRYVDTDRDLHQMLTPMRTGNIAEHLLYTVRLCHLERGGLFEALVRGEWSLLGAVFIHQRYGAGDFAAAAARDAAWLARLREAKRRARNHLRLLFWIAETLHHHPKPLQHLPCTAAEAAAWDFTDAQVATLLEQMQQQFGCSRQHRYGWRALMQQIAAAPADVLPTLEAVARQPPGGTAGRELWLRLGAAFRLLPADEVPEWLVRAHLVPHAMEYLQRYERVGETSAPPIVAAASTVTAAPPAEAPPLTRPAAHATLNVHVDTRTDGLGLLEHDTPLHRTSSLLDELESCLALAHTERDGLFDVIRRSTQVEACGTHKLWMLHGAGAFEEARENDALWVARMARLRRRACAILRVLDWMMRALQDEQVPLQTDSATQWPVSVAEAQPVALHPEQRSALTRRLRTDARAGLYLSWHELLRRLELRGRLCTLPELVQTNAALFARLAAAFARGARHRAEIPCWMGAVTLAALQAQWPPGARAGGEEPSPGVPVPGSSSSSPESNAVMRREPGAPRTYPPSPPTVDMRARPRITTAASLPPTLNQWVVLEQYGLGALLEPRRATVLQRLVHNIQLAHLEAEGMFVWLLRSEAYRNTRLLHEHYGRGEYHAAMALDEPYLHRMRAVRRRAAIRVRLLYWTGQLLGGADGRGDTLWSLPVSAVEARAWPTLRPFDEKQRRALQQALGPLGGAESGNLTLPRLADLLEQRYELAPLERIAREPGEVARRLAWAFAAADSWARPAFLNAASTETEAEDTAVDTSYLLFRGGEEPAAALPPETPVAAELPITPVTMRSSTGTARGSHWDPGVAATSAPSLAEKMATFQEDEQETVRGKLPLEWVEEHLSPLASEPQLVQPTARSFLPPSLSPQPSTSRPSVPDT
ncbi:hypothetical protein CDCA_CDCA03G1151 [Cyanidium caldarium]|uniref:Uncharacterized protein n=1 Tax=Cyanidium caldarium TaxID=2771 RepID=A0AAV9ISR1_CYACA|nr:hypothetical protein CDCA_CDCA03G1151 [Cyanidium caldarium]